MKTASQPVVSVYILRFANGHQKKASQVTFPDGQVIRFMDKTTKRNAIACAQAERARLVGASVKVAGEIRAAYLAR